MGSCCSCSDKDTVPDNHRNKFKVINVDDDGNELGSGVMEVTDTELVLYTRKRDSVKWHYLCLRRYGYESNLFSFESGRRCQTGQGIFAFKCARAGELFNRLQEIMQNNNINVVEEPVVDRSSHQTELEVPRTPRTSTTPGLGAQNLPNGYPRYPSFRDASSHPSSRHPSVGSARLPSVGEESTHPLLVAEKRVHTYVNTTGVQKERKNRANVHVPPEARVSNAKSNTPKEEPNNNEDRGPQVLLKPEGVKFVLGPTPVQCPSLEHRQLNYIQVDLKGGNDSDNPQTPKTPTTPFPQTPTRRTELYAVIDIERTAAISNLQKALPRDDGTSRKTRHNSTDLPM